MLTELYFIALIPPEAIREEVRALKVDIQRRFGAGHALKSPAHITLQMPFRMAPEALGELENTLQNFAAGQQSFPISLDGFDCFAPRVIFIRITEHELVIALEKELKTALLEAGILPGKGTAMPFHPHMTIATRDLEEPAFERAWAEHKDLSFRRSFEVQKLFLLRHNGKYWDIFREYGFGK